jgi:predicted RNase H-like nuclease
LNARVVLGIDAAWTPTNPSGVALGIEREGRWRLLAAEPSYAHFTARADGREAPQGLWGAKPVARQLLEAAERLAGRTADIVAVDMPLARTPICGRRTSDIEVSKAYGARRAATHSPSEARPGSLSDDLRGEFEAAGYPLLTSSPADRGLIEVYPHPALIEFDNAGERLKYKASKARAYWPDLDADSRWLELNKVWARIVALLEARLEGAAALLPLPSARYPIARVKGFEDALDAAVCVAIGVEVLEGRAKAYGDTNSAIWVPSPGAR